MDIIPPTITIKGIHASKTRQSCHPLVKAIIKAPKKDVTS